MIVKVADSIISPLGFNTDDNYNNLLLDTTKLSLYEGLWNLPEPFVGSLFDNKELNDYYNNQV